MQHGRFQVYNVIGGIAWVNLFVWAGFFFGNLPLIRDHFGLVTLGIIAVSMLPMLVMIFRREPAA